jgi:lipid-A-disaccharide synthase-like uncharacterized protein
VNCIRLLAATAAERGSWWPASLPGRLWVSFGLLAQLAFSARLLVQWIASERRRASYVPKAFWYLSLIGGAMLLTYFVFWKRDAVGAIGQTAGCVVYVRNLMLLSKAREHGVAGDIDGAAAR